MKQRILIVDDDPLVADTLRLIYRANGFDSEAAYSAAEALRRARTFAPELVVCDVAMPEENGLSLVEKMNREMPRVQMLMLTAYTNHAEEVERHAVRMKRPLKMLAKPCPPAELLTVTRALLNGKAA